MRFLNDLSFAICILQSNDFIELPAREALKKITRGAGVPARQPNDLVEKAGTEARPPKPRLNLFTASDAGVTIFTSLSENCEKM